MESIEENKMCRLCLQSNESLFDIFKVNNNIGYVAAELIEDLMELQVSKKDHYPQFICEKCLEKLIEFKNFKTQGHISKATYDNVFAADGDKDQEEVMIVKAEPIVRVYDDEREDRCSYQVGQNCLEMIESTAEMSPISKNSNTQNPSCQKKMEKKESDICEIELDHVTLFEENSTGVESGISFKCQECNKTFSKITHYVRHYKTHGSKFPFYCGYCSEKFPSKNSLDLHMNEHAGDKPLFCSFCKKRYKYKNSLDRHLRVHAEKKPKAR